MSTALAPRRSIMAAFWLIALGLLALAFWLACRILAVLVWHMSQSKLVLILTIIGILWAIGLLSGPH